MSDLKRFKLGDIIEDVAMGPFGSNLKVDNFISIGVPVIRGGNLNQNGFDDKNFVFVSEEKAQSLKRSLAYPDDLVFTHRGTIGQVGIIEKTKYPYYLVSQSQMRLTVNRQFLNPRFLYYWFKSTTGQYELLKNSAQVGVPAIASPTKSLKEIDISIPDLPTQIAISEILSSLDDKIELNNKINQELENLAQTIFKQWFIDFEFPNENGEPYKSSGGEMVESELGEIPKGWEVGTIYKISDVIYGAPFKSSLFNQENRGFPLIRIRDLKTFKPQYWTEEIHPKRTKIYAGDLIVGMDAEFRPQIWLGQEAWLNQRLCHFKPKAGFSKLFVREIIRPQLAFFENSSVGTTVIHLGKADIDTFKSIIPTERTLVTFEELSTSIFNDIINNSIENQQLTNLRDTLLPKLISGELEVSQIKTTS